MFRSLLKSVSDKIRIAYNTCCSWFRKKPGAVIVYKAPTYPIPVRVAAGIGYYLLRTVRVGICVITPVVRSITWHVGFILYVSVMYVGFMICILSCIRFLSKWFIPRRI